MTNADGLKDLKELWFIAEKKTKWSKEKSIQRESDKQVQGTSKYKEENRNNQLWGKQQDEYLIGRLRQETKDKTVWRTENWGWQKFDI